MFRIDYVHLTVNYVAPAKRKKYYNKKEKIIETLPNHGYGTTVCRAPYLKIFVGYNFADDTYLSNVSYVQSEF